MSRSPDFIPRVGLQKDAKRDFARITRRVNVSHVVFKMASNYECVRNIVRHCEFSGKDDTDEEFLDFEVPSSYEGEGNSKSKNKTQTEYLLIVFFF